MSQIARDRALVFSSALIIPLFLATSVAGRNAEPQRQQQQRQPQQQQQGPQLQDHQKKELQSLIEAVRGAVTGQLTPTEKPFTFNYDYLKGTEGNTYVPFTLVFEPSKFTSRTLAMYLRVDRHSETPPAAAPPAGQNQNRNEPQAPALPPPVFEDAYFVELGDQQGKPEMRFSRAFTAPGGEYDVYVALRDSTPTPGPDAPKIAMQKEQVAVPNLWSTQLQTSTVILADAIEPLSAPLTPEQQVANPYTLGTTRIVPKATARYGKQEELSMLFLVYNPGLKGGKPDVTVEYNFYQRAADGEKYFNKTSPQEFNAQTLPPEFDVAAGHQIVAGQTIPLKLFPEGDYRLEIKVTDNTSGSAVTQNVSFTVLPA